MSRLSGRGRAAAQRANANVQKIQRYMQCMLYRTQFHLNLLYAQELLEETQDECPVDTGALRASLYVVGLGTLSIASVQIFSNLEYFHVVAARDGFVHRGQAQALSRVPSLTTDAQLIAHNECVHLLS